MKRLSIYGLILMSMYFVCGCGPNLQDYEPKNEQEKEIKGLLVEFGKARNGFNVPGIVSLMTDDCKIYITGRELSKSEFAQWTTKDLEAYGQWKLTNPEIRVTDDVATAKLRCIQSFFVSQVYSFKMIRQNNRWMISDWTAT